MDLMSKFGIKTSQTTPFEIVHTIASGERVNKLIECALSQNDDRLVRVLNCDDYVLKRSFFDK
jgi:hypothetical protein